MRLWTLHPKYLDAKGLVALWREALLAKNVLEGKTKGYRSHPQLLRFRDSGKPLAAINSYLHIVWEEAASRKYNFDKTKVIPSRHPIKLRVTTGQVQFEFSHLLRKLSKRDRKKYLEIISIQKIRLHPLFRQIPGPVEIWERNSG